MKMLAKDIRDMEVSRVIRVPPRYSQLPRSASIDAMEKQTNTKDVPSSAVTIIDGSTTLTYSNNGPIPIPKKVLIGLLQCNIVIIKLYLIGSINLFKLKITQTT